MALCPYCGYECSGVELGFAQEPVFSCPVDDCPVELFRLIEGVNDANSGVTKQKGGES